MVVSESWTKVVVVLCSTPPLMILERSHNWPKVYADSLSLHVSNKASFAGYMETWPARQKRAARWEPLTRQVMLIQFASLWGMLIRLKKSCIVRTWTKVSIDVVIITIYVVPTKTVYVVIITMYVVTTRWFLVLWSPSYYDVIICKILYC